MMYRSSPSKWMVTDLEKLELGGYSLIIRLALHVRIDSKVFIKPMPLPHHHHCDVLRIGKVDFIKEGLIFSDNLFCGGVKRKA